METGEHGNFQLDNKFNSLLWYLGKFEALNSEIKKSESAEQIKGSLIEVRVTLNKLQLELNLIFDEYYNEPDLQKNSGLPYLTKTELKELVSLCHETLIIFRKFNEKSYQEFKDEISGALMTLKSALLEALIFSL